ncbi:unnamed protein product [Camellia sinensis]
MSGRRESTLLKKHSSSTYPSTEAGEGTKSEASLSKTQQKEPLLIETVLLVQEQRLLDERVATLSGKSTGISLDQFSLDQFEKGCYIV